VRAIGEEVQGMVNKRFICAVLAGIWIIMGTWVVAQEKTQSSGETGPIVFQSCISCKQTMGTRKLSPLARKQNPSP